MWRSTVLRFPPGHPVAAGHFPSDPIIPGGLLLDQVLEVIAGGSNVSLSAAKFLAVVRPGQALSLRWRQLEGGAIAFECLLADTAVAMSGRFEMRGPA